MFSGRCKVCGTTFLDSTQEEWLREKITDPRQLDHIMTICPKCRNQGHGLIRR
jgi:uncharacterized protein with PIN domain